MAKMDRAAFLAMIASKKKGAKKDVKKSGKADVLAKIAAAKKGKK